MKIKSPEVISFSPQASQEWIRFANWVESQICFGGKFERASDHASKLADNVARIAALMHCFEEKKGEIDLDTLSDAISIATWYSDEFLRMFVPPPQDMQDSYRLQNLVDRFRSECRRYVRKNFMRQCSTPVVRNSKLRFNCALDVLQQQRQVAVFKKKKTLVVDLAPWLIFDHLRLDDEIDDD